MSEKTIKTLVETRKRVVMDVNQGKLSVDVAARILGMSRQGLWKLRKKVDEFGLESVVGRKRGIFRFLHITMTKKSNIFLSFVEIYFG